MSRGRFAPTSMKGEGGARTGAKGGERELEEEKEKTATAVPVVTRSGHTIRPPQRLQVLPPAATLSNVQTEEEKEEQKEEKEEEQKEEQKEEQEEEKEE